MMNIDIFIRNFKLSLICDAKMDEPYCSLYNELESTFADMYMYKNMNDVHGYTKYYTYYGKRVDNLSFSYNSDRKNINLNYENTCRLLAVNFQISMGSIINLVQWYLDYKYGIKGDVINPLESLDLDNQFGNRSSLKECGKLCKEKNTHYSI